MNKNDTKEICKCNTGFVYCNKKQFYSKDFDIKVNNLLAKNTAVHFLQFFLQK